MFIVLVCCCKMRSKPTDKNEQTGNQSGEGVKMASELTAIYESLPRESQLKLLEVIAKEIAGAMPETLSQNLKHELEHQGVEPPLLDQAPKETG